MMTPSALTTAKTSALAALTALALATTSAAPARAWGDKEQNFVAGVVTALIIDELIEGNKARKVKPAPAPVPVYADPEPHYGSVHSTPAARAFNSYSREERKAIQRQLRAAGYYRGGIDGAFGNGTYRAVTAYARDTGASGNLKTTGGAFAVYDGLLF